MPDYIGNILVPEIMPSGTFPIVPDYPHGSAQQPQVIVHQFGSGNAKIEQRFLLGTGAKRFTVRKAHLREADRIALLNFWESNYGPYGAFYYDAPNDDGQGTTRYVCRFATEPLSWEMLGAAVCSVGVTLIEIPQTSPSYPLNQTVNRFPPAALQTALLAQVQEIIPLVHIQPLEPGYPTIYVSDRRCTIGGQLYQARLVDWDGISQSINGEADEARFAFGNADRVMRDLANDVDLFRAEIDFSLFHVGTGIKLDLWKGHIIDWSCDAGPEFHVTAADGLYDLNLPYPTRKISRTCWKRFNDGQACPFATHGSLDLVNFPNASATSCDKGFDTPNGCRAHSMNDYFGGIIAKPQGVRIKDNSTGVWGFGRSTLTSVSLVADSIYDQVVPEIYTDSPMPVNAKIAMGRDESDFYAAVGIVGEGPLGAYGSGHKLDGQTHHGYPGPLGLLENLGPDPNPSPFGFDTDAPVISERAAGTAFVMIRRVDAKGIQLPRLSEHAMEVIVSQGLGGWIWTAPGQRSWQTALTNPIWIAVNMLMRARGLRAGNNLTWQQLDYAETLFDVHAAVAAAAICNQQVPQLIGSGIETQFKFRGLFQEEKPLRDWLQEVLINCLGYYTFANGKLKLGVRVNSSAVEAFTEGNILFGSLQLAPLKPSFNHLTANFADEDYNFVTNSISLYDIDHATLIGGGAGPLFLKSTVNLSGTASKSQAARIITVRLREELGGVTPEEWKKARQISFRTTVLALNTEPGMVCSMTHPDMPGGSGEFRVTRWRLNRDYSIDIDGRTTTDSMYDLVAGPKPADVVPAPPAVEWAPIEPQVWHPNSIAPYNGDPIADPTWRSFHIDERYVALDDGSVRCALGILGSAPINVFHDVRPAAITGFSVTNSGGSLPAGSYYIVIAPFDGSGVFAPPSNLCRALAPSGIANAITLQVSWPPDPPGGWAGYVLWAADAPHRLTGQVKYTGALPATVTLAGPLFRSTYNLPNPTHSHIRLRATRVRLGGIAYGQISAVGSDSITVPEFAGNTSYTGRILSVLSSPGGETRVWNYTITSHDLTTGAMTVSPDPQAQEMPPEPGGMAVVRCRPTAVAGTMITDSMLALATDALAGCIMRILYGAGAGQARPVRGNTATSILLESPFAVAPDATSIFVVTESGWEYLADSAQTHNADLDGAQSWYVVVDNFSGQHIYATGALVDRWGAESPALDAPWREIYITGKPGAAWDAQITIVDGSFPLVQGDDIADNRYGVLVEQGSQLRLVEWVATLKVQGTVTIRVMVSSDSGASWTSIFPPGSVQISGTTASGSTFAVPALQRGDLLRYDVVDADGHAGGLWLALRARKETI